VEANFFERVYAVARQIPYGRVTSYGAIAMALEVLRLLLRQAK
jgi:methylated-DNA-protein-cysteine methyltransferase-like protein